MHTIVPPEIENKPRDNNQIIDLKRLLIQSYCEGFLSESAVTGFFERLAELRAT